jgi:enterochelin esterase-like enzyme
MCTLALMLPFQNCSNFSPAAGDSLKSSVSAEDAYGNRVPSIVLQPSSLNLAAGASRVLSVIAEGHPAPSYQWYMNGVPLTAATASTHSIAQAQSADAGSYYVVITNSAGSVRSQTVTISVSGAGTPSPTPSPTPGATPTPTPQPTPPPVLDPGTQDDGDRVNGPNFMRSPDLNARANVPKGTIIQFTMKSSESKIFPGDTPLTGAYSRGVAVYIPKQYVAGTDVPIMISQDGNYRDRLPTLLDNYIADKKLPVMIVAFVNNGRGDAFGTQRNQEYDTVSGRFGEFLDKEVIPRIELETKKQLPAQAVKITKDPEGRGTIGCSSGGSASFGAAWWHPELFRRVISYSGTFTNRQSPMNPALPHGAWDYHAILIPNANPPKPIRVWLQVGTNDNNFGEYLRWDEANQRMAKALAAKDYDYHFDRSLGAGHCDGRVVDQTLPEAMLWLWRGYPIK